MRILLIPRFKSVDGDSSLTTIPMSFVKIAVDCGSTVDIVVQKKFDGQDWFSNYISDDDKYRKAINIIPIDFGKSYIGAKRVGFMIGNHLSKILSPTGKSGRFYDIILSNAFASHPAIKMWSVGSLQRGMQREIPLVGWSVWSSTHEWNGGMFNNYDAYSEIYGALLSDSLVFESEQVKKDHIKSYRRYLNPSEVLKIMNNVKVVNNGIYCDRIKTKYYNGKNKPVGLWSGYYREDGEKSIEALLSLYSAGKLSKVVLQFMDGTNTPEEIINKYKSIGGGVEVVGHMTQNEYIEFISDADLFVCTIDYKKHTPTYGIRWGEMIASGCLPIICQGISDTFLPEGYPYACKVSNVKSVLSVAIKDLEKNNNLCKEYSEYVLKNHDLNVSMLELHNYLEDVLSDAIEKASYSDFDNLVKKALGDIDEIGHDDACELIQPLTRSKSELINNAMIPPGFLRWAILKNNFKDIGVEYPYYKRN